MKSNMAEVKFSASAATRSQRTGFTHQSEFFLQGIRAEALHKRGGALVGSVRFDAQAFDHRVRDRTRGDLFATLLEPGGPPGRIGGGSEARRIQFQNGIGFAARPCLGPTRDDLFRRASDGAC